VGTDISGIEPTSSKGGSDIMMGKGRSVLEVILRRGDHLSLHQEGPFIKEGGGVVLPVSDLKNLSAQGGTQGGGREEGQINREEAERPAEISRGVVGKGKKKGPRNRKNTSLNTPPSQLIQENPDGGGGGQVFCLKMDEGGKPDGKETWWDKRPARTRPACESRRGGGEKTL